MALKQNHDYKQIYDETYAFMSKAIGDGALNGGKDGLVRALSNLEIDGKKININDKNIQAAIEKHFQNAFKNIKIKDFKIAKIDFSDLFNLDKKALQNEVNKVLKDLEVNQSSKEANRRLYALGTVANAKGYDVIGAGGGKIDKEYLKDLQHYAGITDTHVEMINKRIGEIGKNIDLSGLIKELIDMTNQMDKAAEKAAKDAEKMQKAQKKAEDAAKKSAAKTKAEKAKTTTDKKQETPSPPAPTVDTTKTTKDIDKMDQVVRDTEEDVHKLQMALKDALGFGYAIDDKSNPLQSLITNVQDGVATLEETMEKVKKVGKFNELINTSDVATQATSGEGLEKFNSSLVEIADNSLTAEDAFNKFRNEVKGGSNFIGNEGQTTAKRKDDIADLSNELKRLQDVLAQVADSENDFEQKIAQDAKKSIETIEDYIQKKSMVFDAHAQKWVPVKPKEEKIQEEVSKKKLNFDNPEMQNVLAAMFGKATETKQEVEKVAESFDEVAQSGTSAGEKIAKGMAEVRQEAKKTKETIKEVKQATDEETKPVESSDFQKARINQQLEALRKIRNQKEADYKTEKRHLDDLQALSNAYYQRMQNTVGVDNYKEAYQNARRENFDLIDNKPVSHTDALFHQAQVHAKRFARTGDDQSLGKAAGYYQQYVNAMKEANQEAEKLKIGKRT